MELTKEEAILLHRELWGWLVDNPTRNKNEWPRWGEFSQLDPKRNQYCFACMITYDDCEDCILKWPGSTCSHLTENDWEANGLFEQWDACGNKEERSKLAAQIRDLPVREEVPNAPTT